MSFSRNCARWRAQKLADNFNLLITIAEKTSIELLNETHWSDKAENKMTVYNVTGTRFNDFDVNHFNIFRPGKKNTLATRPSDDKKCPVFLQLFQWWLIQHGQLHSHQLKRKLDLKVVMQIEMLLASASSMFWVSSTLVRTLRDIRRMAWSMLLTFPEYNYLQIGHQHPKRVTID